MVASGDQSSIANSPQSIQINVQLHERELQLRSELTRALLELAEESEHPLCLFIDGYEQLTEAGPEPLGWFWEEVLAGLAKALPYPFQVIICGWQWPSNAAIGPFIQRTELTDFDVEQMKGFLEKQEVLPASTDPAVREMLISVFYDLTQGHPLVLGLAVTYFKHLPPTERTAVHLQANALLIDSRARVEFLEQRLLERLPEPDRTLLERGPILRGLDQAALQALLSVERAGTGKGKEVLDDATYDRFLRYPFINRESGVEQGSQETQPTFHELVRRVQVETLRRRPDQFKEQLHRTMADYYRGRAEEERVRVEFAFRAHVEYLYHALQLPTQQVEAYTAWQAAIKQAINGWHRRQAEALLQLIVQLEQEGEPFLSAAGLPYCQFLIWFARFLEQDLRWQEAETVLKRAAQMLEYMGHQEGYAIALNNLALLYRARGADAQAEPLLKRALMIREQTLGPQHPDTAQGLNNLAELYRAQGAYAQAEPLLKRALAICEQVLGPQHPDTAACLDNLGKLYLDQGAYAHAEPLLKRALAISEQVRGPQHLGTATCLHNLAMLYFLQGASRGHDIFLYRQAESLMKRGLEIYERVLGPEHPQTKKNQFDYRMLSVLLKE